MSMVYDTWMDWIVDVQPMYADYVSFMDDDKCLNDDDAVWTEDDEETSQGNSWIYNVKCLRDDSEVDKSLAPGEKMGQGTNSKTIKSLPGQGTT